MNAPPRTAVLRHFLYLVLFTKDLSADVPRAIAYHRANADDGLRENLRELVDELAHPTVEARSVDELLSRFSESELRSYLAAVAAGLSADAE